ncbi:MAG: glycosyltransferase family 2 protein [Candidatus Ancillula sp.]|jgi:glycosyltransferase involved in cell wall biosynthesis|nr:glycosyltransferase family 2 protein [Candidatus Ancillula sp.]
MKKIAVLVPCYNESATISKVVNDFNNVLTPYCAGKGCEFEVFVYDNNSTDGSAALAAAAGATVVQERRQGKGNVVQSQFRDVDADAYLMVDGDDTYEAADCVKMLDEVLDNNIDMVIGDRLSGAYFTENKRAFHNTGNKAVRNLINQFFKSNINDIMTGYRAFSRQFVKTFPVVSRGFEIETEMTIHAVFHNLRVSELPISYRDRPEGSESKLNTISDGVRVLWTIAQLVREYRPLGFFTALGVIVAFIGILLGAVPVLEYINTGLVGHFPSLIVAGFMFIAAFVIWQAGIIMHLIVKKHRLNFEYHYYAVSNLASRT